METSLGSGTIARTHRPGNRLFIKVHVCCGGLLLLGRPAATGYQTLFTPGLANLPTAVYEALLAPYVHTYL